MHAGAKQFLIFLSLPLVLLALLLWESEKHPPIFDAQVHYNQEAWHWVSVKAALNTAEELNVPWLLVGSTPNEGTWRLHGEDPRRVIPMFVPYHSRDDRETWFQDMDILPYLERELGTREYRGIGEFRLFDGQVDTPVVRRMLELAAARDLVLHARADPGALRRLFELEGSVRILWAHAGMFTQPETINEMLERYPRLWVEISHRGDIARNGSLTPPWRELMLRHPRRFLLGSGTYTSKYWYQFRYIHGAYRRWLKELPPATAERIAFRNGLDLFKIDVNY